MPGIFDDERRGSGPMAPDPGGTGRFFAGAPIDVPIRGLHRFFYIVNVGTARRLKLCPPLGVLRYAEIVNAEPPE